MFHVNAWGTAVCVRAGGREAGVPGRSTSTARACTSCSKRRGDDERRRADRVARPAQLHEGERSSASRTLKRVVIGGSACPPAMIRRFQEDFGVEVLHAWGMTEMSPLGTVPHLQGEAPARWRAEERVALQNKQGRPIFGVDMKHRRRQRQRAAAGTARPSATCRCAGPWVCKSYFKGEGGDPLTRTAGSRPATSRTIDPDGYMQITDRSKDVIKSGGEWISSIDLENIAVAHPGGRRGRGDRRAASEVGRAAARWSR